MSELKPESEGASVVLVGSFNPAIFHPAWFAREKLIQIEEAERADLQIVSPQASLFSIGWLRIEVIPNRFAALTTQIQHLESLRDLVLGTFGLLRHTPLAHMGINRQAHFRSTSEEEWHALGHRLAPKEPWAGALEKPGMKQLSMQGQRPDSYPGRITVMVEPSIKMKPGFGVHVEVNDHFDSDGDDKGGECDRMMEILADVWQTSLDRSWQIMQILMKAP